MPVSGASSPALSAFLPEVADAGQGRGGFDSAVAPNGHKLLFKAAGSAELVAPGLSLAIGAPSLAPSLVVDKKAWYLSISTCFSFGDSLFHRSPGM